jgi:hypothetical protein
MRAVAAAFVLLAATLAVGFGDMNTAVTLTARPTIVRGFGAVTLAGAISDPRAGELVTVEAKECGIANGFRAVAGTQTAASGVWTLDYQPRSTTVLRAAWKSTTSDQVTVKQRAPVQLVPRPGRMFRVSLYGIVPLDGKRVTVERFDPAASAWRRVQTVVVRSKSYGEYAEANVRITVKKGTTLRAVLPLAQAKPCYLAGFSTLVRT